MKKTSLLSKLRIICLLATVLFCFGFIIGFIAIKPLMLVIGLTGTAIFMSFAMLFLSFEEYGIVRQVISVIGTVSTIIFFSFAWLYPTAKINEIFIAIPLAITFLYFLFTFVHIEKLTDL